MRAEAHGNITDLRLWILLTGLWVMGCGTFAAIEGQWFQPNHVYEIVDPNGGEYVVETPANISPQGVADYVEKVLGFRPDCLKDPRGPWCDCPKVSTMPRDYTKLIAILLLPPMILLALGSSIYWARFRKS
jgi:hypothetical protein